MSAVDACVKKLEDQKTDYTKFRFKDEGPIGALFYTWGPMQRTYFQRIQDMNPDMRKLFESVDISTSKDFYVSCSGKKEFSRPNIIGWSL